MNYGQMQKQSWSISSKDHIADNDDDDIQSGLKQLNEEPEEEQTLKPAHTFKSARQTIAERKLHEDDIQ
jgi:hypothetical protein